MTTIFLLFTHSSCESLSDTEYHSDVEIERSYLRSRSREKSDNKEYSGYSSLRGKSLTISIKVLNFFFLWIIKFKKEKLLLIFWGKIYVVDYFLFVILLK